MPANADLDLSVPRRVHIVGIGGSGMSAIAEVLLAMGHRVSGSDLTATPVLERLAGLGADVHVGHSSDNLAPVDVVAVSTAVKPDNPEVVEATRRGVAVVSRARVLAAIVATRRTVAVAGTHGKTTTSAMLAHCLIAAGWQPSFIVGGRLTGWESGARWDVGEWLVVEADESDGTFLELPVEAAVVTSVEPDHLDHHGGFAALVSAFEQFLARVPGPVLVCVDDPTAGRVATVRETSTFGTSPTADFWMADLETGATGSRFVLRHRGSELGVVEVPVPGRHNAANAAAAVSTATLLGAPFDACVAGLRRYGGVARRFEHRGERAGVTFVDDYAHLPGEVVPTLAAARDGGWRRVVCVFQPHRYSRTEALWRDFAHAFDDADILVVTDIYSAGETPRPGVSGKLIVDAVLDADPTRRVAWLPRRSDVVSYLRRNLRAGDLCLTLGAGDLTTLPNDFLAEAGESLGSPEVDPHGAAP